MEKEGKEKWTCIAPIVSSLHRPLSLRCGSHSYLQIHHICLLW